MRILSRGPLKFLLKMWPRETVVTFRGVVNMQVRDLKHWPPQVNGEGWNSTPSSKQAALKKVVHTQADWIAFSCEFEDELYAFDLEIADPITLVKVKAILEQNLGKNLSSIAEIEIPER